MAIQQIKTHSCPIYLQKIEGPKMIVSGDDDINNGHLFQSLESNLASEVIHIKQNGPDGKFISMFDMNSLYNRA